MAVSDVSWRDSIYSFPYFQRGKVTFSTGFTPDGEVLVNYNLYYMRIEIINEKGDTVEVLPSDELKKITIRDRHFRVGNIQILNDSPHATFVEVTNSSPAALGIVRYMKDEKREHWPYRRVADVRGQPATLDRYYSKAKAFFFVVENKFYPATKPKLLSISRAYKDDVEEYLDKHQTDFNIEHDLIRLLNFYNSINAGN
jgi:hypothetical protein